MTFVEAMELFNLVAIGGRTKIGDDSYSDTTLLGSVDVDKYKAALAVLGEPTKPLDALAAELEPKGVSNIIFKELRKKVHGLKSGSGTNEAVALYTVCMDIAGGRDGEVDGHLLRGIIKRFAGRIVDRMTLVKFRRDANNGDLWAIYASSSGTINRHRSQSGHHHPYPPTKPTTWTDGQ